MKYVVSMSLWILVACPVFAQQTEPPVETSENTGVQLEKAAVSGQVIMATASSEDGGAPKIQYFSTVSGQAGDMVLAAPTMHYGSDSFSLMHNSSVQQELDLVDDQIQQIRDMQKEYSDRMTAALNDVTTGGLGKIDGENIKTMFAAMKSEQKRKMEEILLPHQVERLRQIALQVQMQQAGEMATLTSNTVAEELGISDEQKKRLEKRAAEIKQDLQEKIQKLKENARQELLDELSREQREKLEAMTGAEFEMKQVNWSERLKEMRARQMKKEDNDQ